MKKLLIFALLAFINPINSMNKSNIGKKMHFNEICREQDSKNQVNSLTSAVKAKNRNRIEELIEQKVDINLQDEDGLTPLIIAIQIKSQDMILYLIEKNANINTPDSLGRTPLMHVVLSGDRELVEFILIFLDSSKKAINLKDNQGNTALSIAKDNGFDDLVNLLIENEAESETQLNSQHITSDCDNLKEVDVVLIEPNAIDKHYKIQSSEKINPQIIWQIIKKLNNKTFCLHDFSLIFLSACKFAQVFREANIDQINLPLEIKEFLHQVKEAYDIALEIKRNKRLSNLFYDKIVINSDKKFLEDQLSLALEQEDIFNVKVFLVAGVDPNVKVGLYQPKTAVSYASSIGNFELVEILLKHDIKDAGIVFQRAATRNAIEKLRLFIKYSKVSKNDIDQAFALVNSKGNKETLEFLLQHGADISVKDSCGNDAINNAVKNNNKEIVKLLLRYNANVSNNYYDFDGSYKPTIMFARDEEMAKLLIENGATIEVRDILGNTVIHDRSNINLVDMYIKMGIDVNTQNNDGERPIHLAYHSPEMLNLLISSGADVNAKDNLGRTALFKASKDHSWIESVKILLSAGAHVNIQGNDGLTPLMNAVRYGNTMLASLLIDKGADLNLKDKNGLTALGHATQSNHKNTVKFLLEHKAK